MSNRHEKWIPREGDLCVDLRAAERAGGRGLAGEITRVKTRTESYVFTADGEKYNRRWLTPVSEGRYSARVLVPVYDERVICVRGRNALVAVAQLAENLARLDRKDVGDIVGALAQIVTAASEARTELIAQMSDASKGQLP